MRKMIWGLALCALMQSSTGSAAPIWTTDAPRRSGDESQILTQADAATRDKKYGLAKELYAQVLAVDPSNYRALYQTGWILNEEERDGDAASFLIRATEVKPDQPEAWTELGLSYMRLFALDRAMAAYQKALDLNAQTPRAWRGAGDVYFSRKDYTRATEAYLKAVALQPENVQLNYRLGWCLSEQKRFAEAVPYLNVSYRANTKHLGTVTELGYCYLNLQKWDDATEKLERAVSIDKRARLANYYLGLAYVGAGRTDQARKQAQILEELAPDLATKLNAKISAR